MNETMNGYPLYGATELGYAGYTHNGERITEPEPMPDRIFVATDNPENVSE